MSATGHDPGCIGGNCPCAGRRRGEWEELRAEVERLRRVMDVAAHQGFEALVAERDRLRLAVTEVITQLEDWARESVKGGWSTHQVDPMRREADRLRRVLLP